jgi:hypothetical protein
VTVDIHGGRNIRVPQKIHDQAGVHTLHEQKRRRGMPEIMEAQPGYSRLVQHRIEGPQRISGINRRAFWQMCAYTVALAQSAGQSVNARCDGRAGDYEIGCRRRPEVVMRLNLGPYAGQKISDIPTEYLITVLREHRADLLPIVIDRIGMELNMRMHDQLRARRLKSEARGA